MCVIAKLPAHKPFVSMTDIGIELNSFDCIVDGTNPVKLVGPRGWLIISIALLHIRNHKRRALVALSQPDKDLDNSSTLLQVADSLSLSTSNLGLIFTGVGSWQHQIEVDDPASFKYEYLVCNFAQEP